MNLIRVFIQHGGSFVDDELFSYEGIVSGLRCNLDKWSCFEVVWYLKIWGIRKLELYYTRIPHLIFLL